MSSQDQPVASADAGALSPPAPPGSQALPTAVPPAPLALPPAVSPPSPELVSADERLWAAVAHLSLVLLGIVVPVAVMLTKGRDSEFVTEQALEALNFQVTAIIAVLVASVVVEAVGGTVLLYALVAVVVLTALLAARAAYRGEHYRYPITLRVLHDDASSG